VKKNHVYKNQGLEPIHQKYKANESMSRHNTKGGGKKKKPTIKEKYGKETQCKYDARLQNDDQ
jgi:hypothetical protein